jgi:hypothetical protein
VRRLCYLTLACRQKFDGNWNPPFCATDPGNIRPCARGLLQPLIYPSALGAHLGTEPRILTARDGKHHGADMRTTVTLDADVERLLREAMHRSRRSLKQTLNDAVRASLRPNSKRPRRAAFVIRARPLSLRVGIDPASLNKLNDELEVQAFLRSSNPASTK